jgi:hypothetical protein
VSDVQTKGNRRSPFLQIGSSSQAISSDSIVAARVLVLTGHCPLATKFASIPHGESSAALEGRNAKILRDNPLLDRLIEVGTKALRRGLVSGETLRAPRQQLRQHRASAFDLTLNFEIPLRFNLIARLFGAIRIFGDAFDSLREPALRPSPLKTIAISENLYVTRKNLIPAHPSVSGKKRRTKSCASTLTLGYVGHERAQRMSVLPWSRTNIA